MESTKGSILLTSEKEVRNTGSRNTLTFTEVWDEVFNRAISKDKLYAECRAGHVPHFKIGTKLLFRRDSVEAWICEQVELNLKYKTD